MVKTASRYLHTKILEKKFYPKKFLISTGKVHYTNFRAQFVFILLYIYIQMSSRIYKALNVLLWKIPCRKKSIGEMVVNTPFIKFAGMSVLLKDFVFARL